MSIDISNSDEVDLEDSQEFEVNNNSGKKSKKSKKKLEKRKEKTKVKKKMKKAMKMERIKPEESGEEEREEPSAKKPRSSFELPTGFKILHKKAPSRAYKEYEGPDGTKLFILGETCSF